MKCAFIREHRDEFGIRAMCRVLRVHFFGFYAWLKEPLSHRAQEDERQTELIRRAWADSGKVYGYRKLADDLRAIRATRANVSQRTWWRVWHLWPVSLLRWATNAVRAAMAASLR